MELRHADRLDSIEESATFAVAAEVRRLRAEGIEVADLGGGEPDFPTPMHIVEAAARAMREGMTHYTPVRGIDGLRTSIARSLREVEGLDYSPASDILVTPSAKHAIYLTMLSLINPGDEVLLLSPTWVSHEAIVKLVGGTPVPVQLQAGAGEDLDAAALSEKITARTRAILLNSPSNPTGRVLSLNSLRAIAGVAAEHDLCIISDEIYNRIVYDGLTATSIATLPDAFGRTLTINGFSKTYAMTGWRLGYVAGPGQLIGELAKAGGHTFGCAASFAQVGAVAALDGPQECVQEMVQRYDARRRRLVAALDELPGITCALPQGAFYAWVDISGADLGSAAEFSTWLLKSAHVASTPGTAFGLGGEGYIRLSFANSDGMIDSAIERFQQAMSAAPVKESA